MSYGGKILELSNGGFYGAELAWKLLLVSDV